MCLDAIHTKAELREWLKQQPSPIVAYKCISVDDHNQLFSSYSPLPTRFKKTVRNTVDMKELKRDQTTYVNDQHRQWATYRLGYHLCMTWAAARWWAIHHNHRVKRCLVRKKDVMYVGEQCESVVIVASSFIFAENENG